MILQQDGDGSGDRVYALKQYTGERERKMGHRESKALGTLQERGNNNIVGYYGSFAQNDTFNLLLQYVAGGNLWHYLRRVDPPETRDEIRQFWQSLSTIFKGLHCVHQLILNSDDSSEYQGYVARLNPIA